MTAVMIGGGRRAAPRGWPRARPGRGRRATRPKMRRLDELPQQRRRRGAALAGGSRRRRPGSRAPGSRARARGEADRERAVVAFPPASISGTPSPRQEHDPEDQSEEEQGRRQDAARADDRDRRRSNGSSRCDPLGHGARARRPPGRAGSPATPEIRSRYGSSAAEVVLVDPADREDFGWRGSPGRAGRARTPGPSGAPKARLEGVSKIGPMTTRSAPASIAASASAVECVETPIRNPRGVCARTRASGRPSAGRCTPSARGGQSDVESAVHEEGHVGARAAHGRPAHADDLPVFDVPRLAQLDGRHRRPAERLSEDLEEARVPDAPAGP